MKDKCFNTYQSKIAPLLEAENLRQIEEWGIQDHEVCEWLAITAEEFGEMSKAIVEYRFGLGLPKNVVKEAIQTATLCLKIAEMFMNESA